MRTLLFVAVLGALALTVAPPLAFAGPGEHLDWGAQLQSGPESCPDAPPIINVVQKVLNDDDSGVAGNAWALDDFVRQIRVVANGDGSFCATVSYQGNFTTFAGTSPGGTGTVSAGVMGTFEGGYTATITQSRLPSPTQRAKGSIGTINYECDQFFNCVGYVDWRSFYFAGVASDGSTPLTLDWWGWVYHAGDDGSWVNATTGNSGDITGD